MSPPPYTVVSLQAALVTTPQSSQLNSFGRKRFASSSSHRIRNYPHTSHGQHCRALSLATTPYTTCNEARSSSQLLRSSVTTFSGRRCAIVYTSPSENHSCPVFVKRLRSRECKVSSASP